MNKYKQIKKQLGITDADVAKMFGYSNRASLVNSARYDKLKKGIVELYEKILSNDT